MARPTRKAATVVKYTAAAPTENEEDEDEWPGSDRSSEAADARDDDADEWSLGDDSDGAPVSKKARRSSATGTSKGKGKGSAASTGKGKRKAGRLSAFIAMPLDVLVEIARYLDPITLLNMSRANKLMHGIFASRSAAPIWSIVRANVYFPDLVATDITDMQITSLVYERTCHICGRGRATIVDYALRKRWCKVHRASRPAYRPNLKYNFSPTQDCQRANLCMGSRLRGLIADLHPEATKCSFFTHHSISGYNTYRKPYYCLPDVQEMSDRLHELDEQAAAARRTAARGQSAVLRRGGTTVAADEDIEGADEGTLVLDNFVQQRCAIVAAAQMDSVELVKWEQSSAASRREADTAARMAREIAIIEKLLAMGYAPADCAIWSEVSQLVNRPTRLTDAIWNRISSKVIEHVERQQSERFVRERVMRLHDRRSALRKRYDALLGAQDGEAHTTFPSFDVFSQLPSVEPLWVPEDTGTLSDDEWAAAHPAILKDVDTARRVIKVGYARALVRALTSAGAPVDVALADKLQAPLEQSSPTSVLLDGFGDLTGHYCDIKRGRIDLGDTAASVTDTEFDSIFSQLVSAFALPRSYTSMPLMPLYGFPEVHAKLRDAAQTGLALDADYLLMSELMKQQLDILKRAKLPNHRSSEAKLAALGSVFKCHKCAESRLSGWLGRHVGNLKDSLTWSEVIAHAREFHTHVYREQAFGANCPQIRLKTETYPDDPAAAALAPGNVVET
ncbi:hypothetical protein JCM3770_001751 [Rhodotorula araucariae]